MKKHRQNKKQKYKIEWSKLFCTTTALLFAVYSIWCGYKYYQLSNLAIQNDATPPDATLAVTCVSTVLCALLSYLLYQMGLKTSRNKYGVDENGVPYKVKNDYIDEEENMDGN